jgi:hypothetical protein
MKHFTTAILTLGLMLAALPTARAQDTICPPDPPFGSTVNGNLLVPPGAHCVLDGVTVTGNAQVQASAELDIGFNDAGPGVTIDGNVYVGTGAAFFSSVGQPIANTIGGNVEAQQCRFVQLGNDDVGSTRTVVGGNVQIENCTGPGATFIDGAQIAGNVIYENNVACVALNSTIGGNLQCQGNDHVEGANDTVAGHKLGQCASFSGGGAIRPDVVRR